MSPQFWKGKWKCGYPETVSGSGSTIKNTVGVRKAIPDIISRYNIKSFFDAPTGDRNWIKSIDFAQLGVEYSGGEYVQQIVNDIGLDCVTQFDVRHDTPPDVDLWLCRDLLFHFSNEDIQQTLNNMVLGSKIKYLLVTTHVAENRPNGLNRPTHTGGFRILILEDHNYMGLGEPLEVFDDPADSAIKKQLLLFDLDNSRLINKESVTVVLRK